MMIKLKSGMLSLELEEGSSIALQRALLCPNHGSLALPCRGFINRVNRANKKRQSCKAELQGGIF